MAGKIVVAGATGNLGKKITRALIERGASVVALGREETAAEKLQELKDMGAETVQVDMARVQAVAEACAGAECVVSAVQGLRDVIVDSQSVLLEGALAAGVPHFIPSDFSTDFTGLVAGENRNFDLRRTFHQTLDAAPIAATAIFNGSFGEILTYGTALLDFNKKTVGYWEDADWKIDFTTMDDTAAFTAAAALDADAPKALHIASFQASASDIAQIAGAVFQTPFALVRLGSREELRAHNKAGRAAHPEGEQEIYPDWQQGQYMQSMFSAPAARLDNNRYPGLSWTSLSDLLTQYKAHTSPQESR